MKEKRGDKIKTTKEIYQSITDKIIKNLEDNNLSWLKGWKTGIPQNLTTKKSYRGMNILLLKMHMDINKFSSPYYLTFKQVSDLKGKVKAGSKGVSILFWNFKKFCSVCKKKGELCTCEEGNIIKIPLIKEYYVFNVEQTTLEIPTADKKEFTPLEAGEKLLKEYSEELKIDFGGDRAYYSPIEDKIQLPNKADFNNEQEFYSVFFHEATHSTGAEKRLKREGIIKFDTFGSPQYAKEEIIAELGASFLCGYIGIEQTLKNNSAYIQHWLKACKEDNKFIFNVVSQSQKATDFILNVKAEAEEPQATEELITIPQEA